MHDSRQSFFRRQSDLDRFRSHLLAREKNRLLDGGIQISGMKFRRPRPRISQQIVQNRLNVLDFALDFRQNAAAGAFLREFASHHLDDARNSCQRIANFVGQPRRKFPDGGEMLGSRHFELVQALDLCTILRELLNHFIELAAQLADVIIALGKFHPRAEVAFAHASDDFFLLFQRAFDQHQQRGQRHKTNRHRAGCRNNYNPMTAGNI